MVALILGNSHLGFSFRAEGGYRARKASLMTLLLTALTPDTLPNSIPNLKT